MAVFGRTATLLGLVGVQAVALVATFPPLVPGLERLGTAGWHHFASLGAVLLLTLVLHKPLRSRRFLAIGVLAFSILATVSGFYLIYWKEGVRADGYQDWGVFWHVAWSWAAAVFFWQHTWVNRVTLAHFFRRSLAALAPATFHVGLYVLGLVGLVVTWGPMKSWFTNDNYVPLSFATWLVAVGTAYASWLLLRRDRSSTSRTRGGVDLALVPVAALATLTGIPLLFFDPDLESLGLKYASKFWHVWPSVLFAVLVFVHGAQLWKVVRNHWRRLGTPRTNEGPKDGGHGRPGGIADQGPGPIASRTQR